MPTFKPSKLACYHSKILTKSSSSSHNYHLAFSHTYLSLINKLIIKLVSVTTGLTVGFTQLNYTGLESTGSITVTLLLKGGISTEDIKVTIIPYNSSPLSAGGKRLNYSIMQSEYLLLIR